MQHPTPAAFIAGLWGYALTASLKAALELDLFTAIAEGNTDTQTLAHRTGAQERGVRILADYLTVKGFLEKHDGRYSLPPDTAAFLVRTSPTYMGAAADFLAAPEMIGLILKDPAATVRAGGSPGLANIAPDNPVWVKFARGMDAPAILQAVALAERAAALPIPPAKVLDIAASHGRFGITMAKTFPNAHVTAVDWQIVLDVARENATRAGVADRFHFLPGSAFEVDWGHDFDIAMMPNILHHFDEAGCIAMLKRVRATLSPTGRAYATEFVPNEDRVTPPSSAFFSYVMLTTTPAGDAYTEAEYDRFARAAGFSGVTVAPINHSAQSIVEFL